VADDDLLITSANLTDSAQLDNCELGVHFPSGRLAPGNSRADGVWQHFDRLMQRRPPALVPIEEPIPESSQ